ncbi:cytochrome d ubiquinol oxidase subunit II [Silvimonas sp.]|uniref:cytochrome d ubiquinol oxidase subunit II n=1 Tax=Silvimonas sp. TaxID=2650811 RepID=UPI0028473878|nr:cytochrome d ubiquinol oxidase subunit II [Silvimonas sp.]MDR3427863.1 cytochrome d ubiquinol oxidase subunit II [Silvimonas sp.]
MELYTILKLVWVLLLGALLSGVGIMMGMDMGVGALLRFVGRNDAERRVALNIIGPHWEGNQVWFILGGALLFAAFPTLYATSFSVFYVVMILLLFSMILRPIAFEYRSKVPAQNWRASWDWVFLISGAVPMILFGAAMGNVLEGVGFHFDWNGQYHQDGSFLWYILNPFALLCGFVSLALAVYQGGAMLMLRAEGVIYIRARRFATAAGMIAALLFFAGGVWVHGINGYSLGAGVNPAMEATPVRAVLVTTAPGAWLRNFEAHHLLWAVPATGLLAMLLGAGLLRANRPVLGWWLGALAWVATIATAGGAMFPFLMPSSTSPGQSLTLWNATSSCYTLGWMLFFTSIFLPIIVAYTSWVFAVMRGKVRAEDVTGNDHAY